MKTSGERRCLHDGVPHDGVAVIWRNHVAETLRKGSRVTGSARERLAADLKKKYGQGRSIRALADETGRSYGFVHRMLSESGVTLRGRGGATRGKVKV
jgi:hypothetical protein